MTAVHLSHRLGNAWVATGASIEDRNPARPDEVVAVVPMGDREIAFEALSAARAALPAWSRSSALGRGEILFRAAELIASRTEAIARELTREEGKTLAEATGEVGRAATILRYFAGRTSAPIGELYASAAPGTRIATLRQPVGVVAVITPWNFPIAIPAWKIAPALGYGNTVVFKPAAATPLTAYRLVEALVDAGLPEGVLNLVFAPGDTVAGTWLVPGGVDALSFTGSEAVGRGLQRRGMFAHTKVQLELGGKNAVVVAPDADIARAADMIVRGGYSSAGQKCTATSRVIAIWPVQEALTAALAERTARLRPGDPLDPSTTLAPLIDEAARDRVAAMVKAAEAAGARPFPETRVPVTGAFHAAVLLDGVTPEMPIANEEVFGPVVSLMSARDLEEALHLHDAVSYGLSGSIFTRDLKVADRFVQSARAGIIHVNGETAGAEPHVAFGGMKDSSSWSREQGAEAEAFYTQTKTVYWEGMDDVGLFDA